MAIKHISYISYDKNFWRRHNSTILTSSRKEEVKNILDWNKETNSRSEVVKRCESQRSVEYVITESSVSDNVKRMEEETESVSEFNVNSNFQWYFEVDKAEAAVIILWKCCPI